MINYVVIWSQSAVFKPSTLHTSQVPAEHAIAAVSALSAQLGAMKGDLYVYSVYPAQDDEKPR